MQEPPASPISNPSRANGLALREAATQNQALPPKPPAAPPELEGHAFTRATKSPTSRTSRVGRARVQACHKKPHPPHLQNWKGARSRVPQKSPPAASPELEGHAFTRATKSPPAASPELEGHAFTRATKSPPAAPPELEGHAFTRATKSPPAASPELEGHAFTRATKAPPKGATSLPKAGVQAQPKRPKISLLLFFLQKPQQNRMSSPKTS
jgi:hypothetical protein